MGPKTESLIALLAEASAELRASGDDYHASRVEECRDLLLQSDFRGIGATLSVFNARSSLNDVQPRPLETLSNQIYTLADAIRREVERGSYREE